MWLAVLPETVGDPSPKSQVDETGAGVEVLVKVLDVLIQVVVGPVIVVVPADRGTVCVRVPLQPRLLLTDKVTL